MYLYDQRHRIVLAFMKLARKLTKAGKGPREQCLVYRRSRSMSHFKNEMYDTIIHVDELSEKSCQKADACQI